MHKCYLIFTITIITCNHLAHGMDISLINTDKSEKTDFMKLVTKDIITYNISPCLDRFDKNALRLVNATYAQWVLPQATLNTNYVLACECNNTKLMNEWRNQGALYIHEEIYDWFDKKKSFAQKLLNSSRSIDAIFNYGVIKNNPSFITFLLEQTEPPIGAEYFKNAHALAEKLHYWGIVCLCTGYINQKQKKAVHNTGYVRYGGGYGGPPPADW